MKYSALLLIPFFFLFTACEKTLIGEQPENTARGNFEVLWKTLDENYPLFSVKHINWDSLHIACGSKINAGTTEAELWDIASELIFSLDDGHVNIFSRDFSKIASSSHIVRTRQPDDFSLDLVKSKYVVNPQTAGAGYITYGMVKNVNTGYIHISSFAASSADYGTGWAYDIDRVIQVLNGCDGIIIDLRSNGGGLIATENIIAGAFIDRQITYLYSQRKTGKGHDDFGEKLPVSVYPRSTVPPFVKKIAVLTNRFTASGGEYATEIFRNRSGAIHIGDTTFGAFGEVTNVAQLPNGWTFRYPCTLTTTVDGKCPEGAGLVPGVLVKNTRADIEAGTDVVIEYAISQL